jgi:hypothetical protein
MLPQPLSITASGGNKIESKTLKNPMNINVDLIDVYNKSNNITYCYTY